MVFVYCMRTLHTRVAEHAGRSFRTGALLTSPPHSNLRAHALSCSSPVTIDNFNILARGNNNIDVRILESLFIYKIRPDLNDRKSTFSLNIVGLGQAFRSVFPSVLPSSRPHSLVVSFWIFKIYVDFEHFRVYLCVLYISSFLLLTMGISRNVFSKYDSYCSPCFEIFNHLLCNVGLVRFDSCCKWHEYFLPMPLALGFLQSAH